eukprot:gnl/TRDRNA2_/TRDRNA2_168831_c2_seq2.p1 gnl/TRDRNA2_/TRDRNA2_168831_c2~~gnl/TRDRNA2_/TRDRNA2_168831_c2_seq2.p1  ORF type:complete len:402 (+),score=68.89 gnl/TRDRNA2_/TRDRNA2_168831_c2_seq2:79-1284(+)
MQTTQVQYPNPYDGYAAQGRMPQAHYAQEPQYYDNAMPEVTHHNAQPEEPQEQKMTMVVPDGATPGTKLSCTAPDGQELRLTVPDGVPPGSVMTLTQDPASKAWKCMAEPVDPDPPPAYQHQPPPQPTYSQPPPQATYSAPSQPAPAPAPEPHRHYVQPGQPQHRAVTGTVSYHGAMPRPSYQQDPMSATTTRQVVYSAAQPMPVNLSYVPPPTMQVGGPPQHILPGQQIIRGAGVDSSVRQVYGGPPPASLTSDPSLFNPPRQMPYGMPQEQRPSYTPPPVVQRPSYTPPPVMFMPEQKPSYTPAPVYAAPPPGAPMPGAPIPQPAPVMTSGAAPRAVPGSVLSDPELTEWLAEVPEVQTQVLGTTTTGDNQVTNWLEEVAGSSISVGEMQERNPDIDFT